MDDSGLFTIICECCGAKIDVDPHTRSIFSIEYKNKKKRSFEEVVKKVTSVGAQAEEKFRKVVEEEQGREERLEKLFQEAKEKAAKDPRKKPPSIFDYD